tara:strand:- start:13882 stop:14394 length:513 start_codon:yes stop_codon:yes gene_type:complete
MKFLLTKQDSHTAEIMGADTVALCKLQGFSPRLENDRQSREEANAFGYKAEFAIARLFNAEPPVINVLSDGGVDIWLDDIPVDVKFTNDEHGPLIFDSMKKFRAEIAILVGRTDDDDVMSINGWVTRKEFKQKADKQNFGYGDRLFLRHTDMNPIAELWHFLAERKWGVE